MGKEIREDTSTLEQDFYNQPEHDPHMVYAPDAALEVREPADMKVEGFKPTADWYRAMNHGHLGEVEKYPPEGAEKREVLKS